MEFADSIAEGTWAEQSGVSGCHFPCLQEKGAHSKCMFAIQRCPGQDKQGANMPPLTPGKERYSKRKWEQAEEESPAELPMCKVMMSAACVLMLQC